MIYDHQKSNSVYYKLAKVRDFITAYKRHSLLALLNIGKKVSEATNQKSNLDDWFKQTGLEGEISRLAYKLYTWYNSRPASLQKQILNSNCLWSMSTIKRLPNLKDCIVECLLKYSKVTYNLIKIHLRRFNLYKPRVIEPGLPICLGDLKLVATKYKINLKFLEQQNFTKTDDLLAYLKALKVNYRSILPKKYQTRSDQKLLNELSRLKKVIESLGYTSANQSISLGSEVLVIDCEVGYIGFQGVVKDRLGTNKWWVEGVYNNSRLCHHYYANQLLVKVSKNAPIQ